MRLVELTQIYFNITGFDNGVSRGKDRFGSVDTYNAFSIGIVKYTCS